MGHLNGVFIDSETGGLDSKVHGITEIAAVAFTINLPSQANDNPPANFITYHSKMHTYIKPNPWLSYCPGALEMQSSEGRITTLEYLQAYGRSEIEAVGMLQEFMHDNIYPNERYWNHQIWAQNADFDHGFVVALQNRVAKECANATQEEALIAGLMPFGKVQKFGDRCDWSCTRKLFTKLGAMGIGEINNLGKDISQKHIMPYYGIGRPQTHKALQDCNDGILCLAHMMHDEIAYYRTLFGAKNV